MEAVFDSRDAEILAERLKAREEIPGPRIGDFVWVDGELRRFAYDWGESIQTTGIRQDGSFYLNSRGEASHSGGLEPPVDKSRIRSTGYQKNGRFWFFHHDSQRAHNGVYFDIACRVYELRNSE